MKKQTTKVMLSALVATTLLTSSGVGEAVAQTREKPVELNPAVPTLKVKPAEPGGTRPTGPGDVKAKDPVKLPDFKLLPGMPGNANSGLPNQGYCKRKGPFGAADTVAFKVQFATQGSTPPAGGWGQTQVKVIFTNGGAVTVPMGQPGWDGTQPFEVDMPDNCYGNAGSCQFTIQVDWNNVVPETSNANNSTTKSCMQPAG